MKWLSNLFHKESDVVAKLKSDNEQLKEYAEKLEILHVLKDEVLVNERKKFNEVMQEAIMFFSALALANEDGELFIDHNFCEAVKSDKSKILKVNVTEDGTTFKLVNIEKEVK